MIMRLPGGDKEIIWDEQTHVQSLIIENPQYWCRFLTDLLDHNDDGSGISIIHGSKSIDFTDEIDVITNPLQLDFNNRRIVNNLLKIISSAAQNEDNYMTTQTLKSQITTYIVDLIEKENYNFNVSTDDFSIAQLAKIVALHIDSDNDDLTIRIIDYLEVMRELAKVKLTVFVNLTSFLPATKIQLLIEQVHGRQLDILLLESFQRDKYLDIPVNIIDQDLCEI